MNIKKLNEELEDLIVAFQLNEMAIYYGTDHGTYNNLLDGYKQLMEQKNGYVIINQNIVLQKEVTQQEINDKKFKPIQKGISVDRMYPLVLV